MTGFWGDGTWKTAAYRQDPLLKSVAGFKCVAEPMPKRNSTNAVVYYFFFASQKPVAARIVQHIMNTCRDGRG